MMISRLTSATIRKAVAAQHCRKSNNVKACGTFRWFVLIQVENDEEGELMAASKATAPRSARTVLTSRATA